jgi:hypothetical protein
MRFLFSLLFGGGSHDRVILKATKKGIKALGMFQSVYNKLEAANVQLAQVVEEGKAQAEAALRNADIAAATIDSHKAFQEKLKELVPTTEL